MWTKSRIQRYFPKLFYPTRIVRAKYFQIYIVNINYLIGLSRSRLSCLKVVSWLAFNLSVKQKEKWGRLAGEEWVTLFKEQDGGVKRASFTVRWEGATQLPAYDIYLYLHESLSMSIWPDSFYKWYEIEQNYPPVIGSHIFRLCFSEIHTGPW